jgi:predicted N-formylglutamate amidohydrolase
MERLTSLEWILTCEHAGNKIPDDYQSLFDGEDEVLKSHRGWDLGAFELAQKLAENTGIELLSYPFTRLFIEPNRSLGHPKLFSEFTRHLPKAKKQEIINRFYLPYRNKILDAIKKNASKQKTTIHIGIHTFTPVLDEKVRDFEIGLLYDPNKKLERDLCQKWKSILNQTFPDFKIRMNQPYKGASDGFTTFLRKQFDQKFYLGIELEVNQKLFLQNRQWTQFCRKMSDGLQSLRNSLTPIG